MDYIQSLCVVRFLQKMLAKRLEEKNFFFKFPFELKI